MNWQNILVCGSANMEGDIVESLHRQPHARGNAKYTAAIRLVEGRMCTMRESVFASMAWKLDFEGILSSHGFYRFNFIADGDAVVDVCHACGRSNHTVSVHVCIYGKQYQAKRVCQPGRYTQHCSL